jgi:hypothetical protein
MDTFELTPKEIKLCRKAYVKARIDALHFFCGDSTDPTDSDIAYFEKMAKRNFPFNTKTIVNWRVLIDLLGVSWQVFNTNDNTYEVHFRPQGTDHWTSYDSSCNPPRMTIDRAKILVDLFENPTETTIIELEE